MIDMARTASSCHAEDPGRELGDVTGEADDAADKVVNDEAAQRRRLSTRVLAGRAFQINTPVASTYLCLLREWIETGAHGAIVFGPPRLGKTMATRWALKALPSLLGCSVPWAEIPVRNQRVASERAFFQHMLRSVRHRYYASGSAADKRDRLTEWLTVRAQRCEVNCVVLFFDEAHDFQEDHYKWLLNMSNELDANGCRLFCLLVGQPELIETKNALLDHGKEQFVGRFMVRSMEFRGLTSAREVTECLTSFDNTEYPARSGLRFPEHYLREACAAGFHLQELAPALWAAFEDQWIHAPLPAPAMVPMHYLTAALVLLLNRCARSGGKTNPSVRQVQEAVASCGYQGAVQVRLRATLASAEPEGPARSHRRHSQGANRSSP